MRVVLWRRRRLTPLRGCVEEDLFDDYDWDDQAEWLIRRRRDEYERETRRRSARLVRRR